LSAHKYTILKKLSNLIQKADIKEETSEKLKKYELLGRFSKPVKFKDISDLINS